MTYNTCLRKGVYYPKSNNLYNNYHNTFLIIYFCIYIVRSVVVYYLIKMSIVYTLVPREIANSFSRLKNAPTAAPPKNLDEALVEKSKRLMKSITRRISKRSKKSLAPTRFNAYQKELQQLIKTKREVEARPLKVQFARLEAEKNYSKPQLQDHETQIKRQSNYTQPFLFIITYPFRKFIDQVNASN